MMIASRGACSECECKSFNRPKLGLQAVIDSGDGLYSGHNPDPAA